MRSTCGTKYDEEFPHYHYKRKEKIAPQATNTKKTKGSSETPYRGGSQTPSSSWSMLGMINSRCPSREARGREREVVRAKEANTPATLKRCRWRMGDGEGDAVGDKKRP